MDIERVKIDDLHKAGDEATHKSAKSRKDALSIREPGRSLFPVARVQKILKADKELPMVAKEAVFIISLATEEFIKQVVSASHKQAERESRSTILKKDLGLEELVVKRADEFFFMEDIFMATLGETDSRHRRRGGGGALKVDNSGPLTLFVQSNVGNEHEHSTT